MTEHRSKFVKFFYELKRRKIVRVIIIYATTAFILLQVVGLVVDPLKLPEWVMSLVIVLLIIGFPLVIVLAWAYHMTPKDEIQPELIHDSNKQDKLSFEHPLPHDKSIVVLPFENMSSDPEQEYFSDGLTEEIITDLSYIHDLLVISRSSAMTFKGSKQTIKKIATKVNVRYVLEGSVRKSGNNLRITAQLIDAKDDSHLWAEKFNKKIEDIFEIQEDVSNSIVNALKLKLNSKEKLEINEHPIKNTQAYEVYLKAREKIWKGDEESLIGALKLLDIAFDIIGENSILYAGFANVYFQLVNMGIRQEEYIEQLNNYIEKLFEIDSNSAYGHLFTGIVYTEFKGNKKQGIKHLFKAYQRDPNNPEIYLWLAFGYIVVGKMNKSYPLVQRFVQIDPLNHMGYVVLAFQYYYVGEIKVSIEKLLKIEQFEPENIFYLYNLAIFQLCDKQIKEALDTIENILKLEPQHYFAKYSQVLKYSILNNHDKMDEYLTKELEMSAKRDGQCSYWLASFYSFANRKDKAIYWLENAVDHYFINYPFLNEYDPLLENLRGEKEFENLMTKTKKLWENFEA